MTPPEEDRPHLVDERAPMTPLTKSERQGTTILGMAGFGIVCVSALVAILVLVWAIRFILRSW